MILVERATEEGRAANQHHSRAEEQRQNRLPPDRLVEEAQPVHHEQVKLRVGGDGAVARSVPDGGVDGALFVFVFVLGLLASSVNHRDDEACGTCR